MDISVTVSPLKDKSGKIIGASKIARDITERIRNERRRTAQYTVASLLAPVPASARGPDGIADIAEKVIDSVVNISTSQTVEAKGGGRCSIVEVEV